MKLLPRKNQIIGRVVVERPQSTIIRPDATKGTTKLVLIDAVSPGAEAAGLKVGDVIVPAKINHFMLEGGARFRPLMDESDALHLVTDLSLDDLHVQTENGQEYVPFDSEQAAKSLGAQQPMGEI